MANEFAMADLEAGQLNALVKIIGGSDVVRQILRSEVVVTVTAKQAPVSKPQPPVLNLVKGAVRLAAIAAYDPAELKTRKGLWVSDDFVRLVRSKAKPVINLGSLSLHSRELTRNAYDREIAPELGEKHIFDESEVCARIEQMTSKQPGGEEGDLLNTGYANLFYLAGCVVYVYWYADVREWRVRTWKLGGGYWRAGDRAFSRN